MAAEKQSTGPADKTARRVRESLEKHLRKGLDLTPSFFRENGSLPGAENPESAAEVFKDPEGAEAATLLSLALQPDGALLAKLEAVLVGRGLSAEEEAEITETLAAPGPVVAIRLPDRSLPLDAALPEAVTAGFVKSLCLTRRLPDEVVSAAAGLPPETGTAALIAFRRGVPSWTREAARLAADLLGRLDRAGEELLEFAAAFASEIPRGVDGVAHLEKKIAWCRRNLDRGERNRERVSGMSFEEQAARGAAPPYADRERLTRTLELCLTLLNLLTGRMELPLPFPPNEESVEFEEKAGVREFIQNRTRPDS